MRTEMGIESRGGSLTIEENRQSVARKIGLRHTPNPAIVYIQLSARKGGVSEL